MNLIKENILLIHVDTLLITTLPFEYFGHLTMDKPNNICIIRVIKSLVSFFPSQLPSKTVNYDTFNCNPWVLKYIEEHHQKYSQVLIYNPYNFCQDFGLNNKYIHEVIDYIGEKDPLFVRNNCIFISNHPQDFYKYRNTFNRIISSNLMGGLCNHGIIHRWGLENNQFIFPKEIETKSYGRFWSIGNIIMEIIITLGGNFIWSSIPLWIFLGKLHPMVYTYKFLLTYKLSMNILLWECFIFSLYAWFVNLLYLSFPFYNHERENKLSYYDIHGLSPSLHMLMGILVVGGLLTLFHGNLLFMVYSMIYLSLCTRARKYYRIFHIIYCLFFPYVVHFPLFI